MRVFLLINRLFNGFGKKKNKTVAPVKVSSDIFKQSPPVKTAPATQPGNTDSAPQKLSQMFVTSLLGEDSHNQIGSSNDLDQALLLKIRQELKQPDVEKIPKLAQASLNLMNTLMDQDVDAGELVRLVEEDPVLLGKVLNLANSAFYKTSSAEIESLNQALVMLGNDGLKKLVMSTLVADKLKISSVYFKMFGANIWKHSHDVAIMAAEHAKELGVNEFRAYLNGLIHDVGKLVIFRLLIDAFQEEAPDLYPSAGFFAKLIEHYGHKLTLAVIKEWQLNPEWIKPILSYQSKIPWQQMDIDSQALYLANHCSEYQFLFAKQAIDQEQLEAGLLSLGIDPQHYQRLTQKIK